MTAVAFDQVVFGYGNETVVDNVTFDIPIGDYVGLIGPNGGGKSTVVKLMLGLIKPASGKIRLFDKDINLFSEWGEIGYVPQYLNFKNVPFAVTVREVLAMVGTSKKKVDEVLEELGISMLANKPVDRLSGGQVQKVYIARALLTEPKLLILDEPTTGIDNTFENEFYQYVSKLHMKGKTIVLVSHDIATVAKEVSHVLCMNRTLVCHGKPEKVLTPSVWKNIFNKQTLPVLHSH